MSAQSLSGSCLSFFKEQLPLQQYNSWIKPLIFEIDGDKLVLTAPNSFTLRIVQERFLHEITKRALPFFSAPPQIELRIEKRASKTSPAAVSEHASGNQAHQESQQAQSLPGF
jgi:chromosomal replication initiator protein